MKKRNYHLYRKIYEDNFGPIPKEPDGRSYDIHHIDGDYANNSPDNLKAVTLQQHFNIHKSQQDWFACKSIAIRMNKPFQEISEMASKAGKASAEQRLKAGTHNFLNKEWSKQRTQKLISEGRNPFVSNNPVYKQLENGTNTFQKHFTCPHCSKIGKGAIMFRYHFNRCKSNKHQ